MKLESKVMAYLFMLLIIWFTPMPGSRVSARIVVVKSRPLP